MSKSVSQFKDFCPEMTLEQHKSIDNYLDYFAPPGEANSYLNYFYRLYWLATRSNAKRVIELGCLPGGSGIALLYAMEKTDGQLWSCDIEPVDIKNMATNGVVNTSRRTMVCSKAHDYGKWWEAHNMGLVDLIYLDAGHGYEDTYSEIKAWLPNLKEGGLLVFHDVEACKTVLQAITEIIIHPPGPQFHHFEYHHFPDCHGHGVLQFYSRSTVDGSSKNEDILSLTSLLLETSNTAPTKKRKK
jgi:hypothetical protein